MSPVAVTPHIYTSPFGSYVEPKHASVWQYALGDVEGSSLQRNQSQKADLPFLDDGLTGERWTYASARKDASLLANNLYARHRITKGDRVLLCMPTSPRMILTFFALQKLLAVAVPCNDAYTVRELAHCVKLVRPKAVAALASHVDVLVAAGVDRQRIVLLDEDESMWHDSSSADAPEEVHSGAAFDAAAPCLMGFTSGTSGLSKAAVITHASILRLLASMSLVPGLLSAQPESVLICLPCFHASGLLNVALGAVVGDSMVFAITKPMDMAKVMMLCATKQCNRLVLVPAIINGLCKSGMIKPGMFPSLRIIVTGSAPFKLEQEQAALLTFPGTHLVQGWGMTETVGSGTMNAFDDPKRLAGSVGRPVPGTELRIVDDDGNDVDEGAQGEIWIRSSSLFCGYFSDEPATRATFAGDGWMRTGDVGVMKANSNLFLVDRKKDLIKYKGFQVAPAELEELLLAHPAVVEAGVVGVKDSARDTEVPRAYVSLRPGTDSPTTLRALETLVAASVVDYKRLRGGIFEVPSLPRSGSGKVIRRELAALPVAV